MSAAPVALFGDWNAQATKDTGRYSPAWIARQLGLNLAHAGPGRHGNIDFCLTNVTIRQRRRLGNGARGSERGSDHDALLYVLDGPGNPGGPIRVLQWNLQRDRPVSVVVSQLWHLIEQTDADVLVLQECAQYVKRMQGLLPSWRIVTGDRQVNQQNVVATRRTQGRVIELGGGWETIEGKDHGPLYSPAIRVDGWLHLIGVHMPPSVNWLRAGKGLPYGPARRVATYVTASRKLVSIVRTWQRKAARP